MTAAVIHEIDSETLHDNHKCRNFDGRVDYALLHNIKSVHLITCLFDGSSEQKSDISEKNLLE